MTHTHAPVAWTAQAFCHPSMVRKILRAMQVLRTGMQFKVVVRNRKGMPIFYIWNEEDGSFLMTDMDYRNLTAIVKEGFDLYRRNEAKRNDRNSMHSNSCELYSPNPVRFDSRI